MKAGEDRIRGIIAWAMGIALWPGLACAVELRVEVQGAGVPLPDAVASLHGASSTQQPGPGAVMDQRDSAFVPGVLAVQAGTVVSFPNSDKVQHQVYSFSPAKRFDLPLYAGKDARPVRFDAPGVVVLGCNIHDWMIGHVVVLDTPYFAKTGTGGLARIDVPPGDYVLRVWHARAGDGYERTVKVEAGMPVQRVELDVAPAREESRGNDRLRALQEKFRRLQGSP